MSELKEGVKGKDSDDPRDLPTAGGVAPSIVKNLATPLIGEWSHQNINARLGAAVDIRSIGGWGGSFTSRNDQRLVSQRSGQRGGNGGDITILQTADIRGTHTNTTSSGTDWFPQLPLITVLSMGGDGGTSERRVGQGGNGGAITYTLAATVSANTTGAPLILLRSVGGSERSALGNLTRGAELDQVALGTYGNGGNINVNIGRGGYIDAQGSNSAGLVAESRGGKGGGNFNNNVSEYATNGGRGGDVTFVHSGEISNTSGGSMGAILQSLGGAGGDNGSSSAKPGGAGGKGGTISATVDSDGSIYTQFRYTFGLVAQSIGGAGGKGASGFFVGGEGGASGDGGDVNVRNAGVITTIGTGSTAIVAQSTGGGTGGAIQVADIQVKSAGGGTGGDGGFLFFGGGGTGGLGGNGDTVKVVNQGSITTNGASAFGILAQSVGGSGGNGGEGASYGFLLGGSKGGTGGGGGNGGNVVVGTKIDDPAARTPTSTKSVGSIITKGKGASAIVAQSIGGGGGTGGTANSKTGGFIAAISIAVGGDGGKGGSGGTAEVYNTSSLLTSGNEANAVEVRSIGGGGGKGGEAFAYAASVAPANLPSVSISFAIGGKGGDGGSGALAKAVNLTDITTTGQRSYGIFAQSVGGGGGTGGSASAITEAVGFYYGLEMPVTVGGKGGGGGAGGTTDVINAGTIKTTGASSTAIFAQSVGGGGGNGWLASSEISSDLEGYISKGTLGALSGGKTVGINLALGGSGGGGGTGGDVSVKNYGSVMTEGPEAAGIFAQSVGGGGGNAGGYLNRGSATATLNVGGSGAAGGGGAGGLVTVNNLAGATISTKGWGAAAIFAQSVGGGGGEGGSWGSPDTAPTVLSPETLKSVVALGTLGWNIYQSTKEPKEKTDKAKSVWSKIVAGGKSLYGDYQGLQKEIREKLTFAVGDLEKNKPKLPDFTVSVGVGGSGGKGGAGGTVDVTNAGSLLTEGSFAYGIFGQSVGGGGGTGGAAVAAGKDIFSAKINVGSTGGDGGAGGTVLLRNFGSISTLGTAAIGMFGQSIGGGGGIGGATSNPNVLTGFAAVTLGGTSGKSSNGAAVTATNSGSISTAGKEAHGLVAQSVGGGGGHYFVKKDGLINPTEIMRLINQDPGYTGPKITAGDAEILVGSLLEWLGLATLQRSFADAEDREKELTRVMPSFAAAATIGGRKDTSGEGGRVDVTHSGLITTEGFGAFGIFAQSVGGGGGFGSDASPLSLTDSTWTIGGSDGASGNGGAINLTFAGKASVLTAGDGGTAVFLQSIGGGGGYGGVGKGTFSIADATRYPNPYPRPIAHHGTKGDGGVITVEMGTGASPLSIRTTGARAHGLHAQSLGGGGGSAFKKDGGNPAFSSTAPSRHTTMQGHGGAITVTTVGNILAKGAGSYGVFLQSGVQKVDGTLDPGRGGGTITFTHTGKIEGGTGDGAAIRIDGGFKNNITIMASSVVEAASGTAILGSYAEESVTNNGKIVGNINLVAGGTTEYNKFYNDRGGLWVTSAGDGFLRLGSKGLLQNEGTIDIGGVGKIAKLQVETGSALLWGNMRIDVNSLTHQSDFIEIVHAGATEVSLDIEPHVIDGLKKNEEFNILRSPDLNLIKDPDRDFPANFNVSGNPVSPITWHVWNNGRDVYLKPTSADFAGTATRLSSEPLTSTKMALLGAWQTAWDNGNTNQAELFGKLANVTSANDYLNAVNSASPEGQAQPAAVQTLGMSKALTSSMSCPVFVDEGTMIDESQCVWSRVTGSRTQLFDGAQTDGFTQNGISYRIGAQWEVQPDWFFGATAAYNTLWGGSSDGYSNVSGTGGDVAFALKHQIGPWLLAGSVSLGYGVNDIDTTLDVGDAIWSSSNSSKVWTGAGRLRAAYEFAFPTWYVRPFVDLDLIYTTMSGYTINGDVFTMRIGDMSEWTLAVHPAIEVGARLDLSPDTWLRPYASAGVTYYSGGGLSTQVELYDNQPDGLSFTSTEYIPDWLFDIGGGVQFFAQNKYELRGEYRAQVGDSFLSQEASLRFSSRF